MLSWYGFGVLTRSVQIMNIVTLYINVEMMVMSSVQEHKWIIQNIHPILTGGKYSSHQWIWSNGKVIRDLTYSCILKCSDQIQMLLFLQLMYNV